MGAAHDRKRDASVDVARGIAMVLVVFGHALIGVGAVEGEPRFGRFLLVLIYSSHMPLFFVISGVLSRESAHLTASELLPRLIRRILWPYILWGVTILAVHYSMSGYTNTRVESFRPWSILWKPPAVMWFLYVLFFAQVFAWIVSRLPYFWRVAAGLIFLIGPYFMPDAFLNARFIGLFLLARFLHCELDCRKVQRLWVLAALIVFILSGPLIWTRASDPLSGYPAGTLEFIPMLFAGPVLIFALAQRFAVMSVLETIGRNSMAIFVTHIFFTAGTRMVLTAHGVDSQALLVVTCAAVGVVGPLALAHAAAAIRISPLLGWA
ncbi:MAG: acyltransferase family protein [Pseudomonadota bacterium]|nr:acyltransferase family protein [Pseudomonadota bacterium]